MARRLSRRKAVVPFVGEKQFNVSPTAAARRRYLDSPIDLSQECAL